MDVAVLGMGRMGRALATRLLDSGHRVTVWNRTPGRATAVMAAGGQEHAVVADAVDGAEVVISMLADDEAVLTVALGQVLQSLGDKAVYVDSSTVSPECSAALAEAFPGQFVAMPVLGSPAAVAAGQVVLLTGGDADLVDRVEPVTSALAGTVRRYDTPPLALTAKLATNLMLLSEVVALAESFAVGRAGGLSEEQLRDLLADSPVLPAGVQNRFEDVLTGSQEGWWSTALGAKDAGLALDIARRAHLDLPAADAVRHRYEEAASAGLRDADIAAVTDLYALGLMRT
jgi:3-hydroxyisobutyrate dehydrogenase